MSEAIDAALKPTAIGALRQLLGSRGGRFGLALLLGGLGAVTLSQASLTRVESNIVELQEFHYPALSAIEDIRSGVGDAAQEAFAYVVSGKLGEKEDFLKWDEAFPQKVREFEKIARLHNQAEAEEKVLFEAIVVLQAELAARATLMFDEYEETGSVSIGTFERYEAAIDQIFPALDDFVAIERSEVAALYSDSLRLESD